MSDIGNIKPAGPVWPQPAVEKVDKKEDAKERRHPKREQPPAGPEGEDEEGGGIDEYA